MTSDLVDLNLAITEIRSAREAEDWQEVLGLACDYWEELDSLDRQGVRLFPGQGFCLLFWQAWGESNFAGACCRIGDLEAHNPAMARIATGILRECLEEDGWSRVLQSQKSLTRVLLEFWDYEQEEWRCLYEGFDFKAQGRTFNHPDAAFAILAPEDLEGLARQISGSGLQPLQAGHQEAGEDATFLVLPGEREGTLELWCLRYWD